MSIAIIVGGGGFQGLPVLRGLHAIGWEVVIADSVVESINRFEADYFQVMPEAKDFEAFRSAILSIVRHYDANVIFPTTMYDVLPLGRLRDELGRLGVEILVSSRELISLLCRKNESMFSAMEEGLPVLPIIDPNVHDFVFPIIGKPSLGWGGRGIVQVHSRDEWTAISNNLDFDGYLWQRCLSEYTEWSVDFAIRSNGQYSSMVCRKRLRISGGFAVTSEIVSDYRVENLGERVAQWLAGAGGRGLFNIQFLDDIEGRLWLSDINPRPGTSAVCALAAGVNLVEFLLVNDVLPSDIEPGIVVRSLSEHFVPWLPEQIKGVVFDLDETLICQKSWMKSKLEITVCGVGELLDPIQIRRFRQEALRIIDEGPWSQLIDVALARAGISPSYSMGVIEIWRDANPGTVVLHNDAISFIRVLQARKIAIALLSDNPPSSQRQKIARLPESIEFQTIVLTGELFESKPNTKGFQLVADKLSIPPDRLLMVGDSPWRDGLGAIQAGYAAALIVKRVGGMSNPLKSIFQSEFPKTYGRVIWVDSLFGMDRVLGV